MIEEENNRKEPLLSTKQNVDDPELAERPRAWSHQSDVMEMEETVKKQHIPRIF